MQIKTKDNDGNIVITEIEDPTVILDANELNNCVSLLKSKLVAGTITTTEKEQLLMLTNNNPYLTPDNFRLNMAKGNYPNHYILRKFGRNSNIADADCPEDIRCGGGLYTGHDIMTAGKLEIVSTSAEDAISGSGANTIQIQGLDENYNRIQEDIELNGLTPVVTVNDYIRQDRASVLSAGSMGSNVGTISAYEQAKVENITMTIMMGLNKTHICCFTVPAGETAYIECFGLSTKRASSAGNNAGEFDVVSRESGGVFLSNQPFECSSDGGPVEFETKMSMVFKEKTDVSMRCLGIDPNNTVVSGHFTIVFVKNPTTV